MCTPEKSEGFGIAGRRARPASPDFPWSLEAASEQSETRVRRSMCESKLPGSKEKE
jgi:hypothetical protein